MKKTLIALAVLASSGAAMAQSTFTLYGVADANLERQKGGTNSVNKLSSGGLNGSRWGLRGSEDLGSGLKGVFQLESGFNIDEGTSGQSGRLFGRQAFVGLEGGFGGVRLGRQYTPIGNVADLIGTKPADVFTVVGLVAANGGYRSDNAITYKTPSFSGFTVEGQYSLALSGNEVPGAKTGRQLGFNGIYANGPITGAFGYINQQDVNATLAGDQKRNEWLLVGGYDLGMAKVMAHVSQTQTGTAAVQDARKMKVYGLNAAFPFGAATVTPGFALAKDVNGSAAAAKDDAKLFTLQGTYDLSKRTALYTNLTFVNNSVASAKGFNTPAADKNSNDLQIGVRHKF